MSTRENLLTVMKKFIENDYLTAARIMEEVEESQAVDVLNTLPPKLSVKVISSLQPNSLASLLTRLPANLFDEIISNLDPQKSSDIILGLPDERQKIVDELRRYRYSNAPVVDSQNHMLGIIRAES